MQTPSPEEQELWRKSYESFNSGILAFEEVNDPANIALLNCNLGQLMRVCAHAYAAYSNRDSGGEFTQEEKHYYNKVKLTFHISILYLVCLCCPPWILIMTTRLELCISWTVCVAQWLEHPTHNREVRGSIPRTGRDVRDLFLGNPDSAVYL